MCCGIKEKQKLDNFERLINGLNSHENTDACMTGCNYCFLSYGIRPIFCGRGDEIKYPPCSSENSAKK